MDFRPGSTDDIAGILALQHANLFENLTEAEREAGFVTTPFTTSQLESLVDERGIFVATGPDRIVGYAMAGTWDYWTPWPIFPFMISRLSDTKYRNRQISDSNSFQYGPICIEGSLRSSDAFPRLFETMRIEFVNRFPIGITFINRTNLRSYHAHTRKLGMEVVDEFDFAGRSYYGLAFETDRTVLRPHHAP